MFGHALLGHTFSGHAFSAGGCYASSKYCKMHVPALLGRKLLIVSIRARGAGGKLNICTFLDMHYWNMRFRTYIFGTCMFGTWVLGMHFWNMRFWIRYERAFSEIRDSQAFSITALNPPHTQKNKNKQRKPSSLGSWPGWSWRKAPAVESSGSLGYREQGSQGSGLQAPGFRL